MPAKHLNRTTEEGTHSHIYNKGVEKRIIFNEDQDYQVFQGFLKEYLTLPADRESAKKTFTVKGRTFRGTPHQPKNYYNKVELIAYSLRPDHFHLILHQKTPNSLESFIRSLCTRYSMYFNKKYQRTGSLFQGPYKSVQIKDLKRLLYLARFIHSTQDSKDPAKNYSSSLEYLGKRNTPWVKTHAFSSLAEAKDYKKFIENHELGQKEKELLEGITLENESFHLAGRNPTQKGDELIQTLSDTNKSLETSQESFNETGVNPGFIRKLRVPEIAGITAVFLLLVTLGIRNINASSSKVLGVEATPLPSPTPTLSVEEKKLEQMVVIKITDGVETVNIRQNPSINSKKIGEAKDGQTFEFVSLNSGWYGVKLDSGLGFIFATYAHLEGVNK